MKGKILCRAVILGVGFPLVVGCVPYQTYQKAKMDLEQAQLANRDLVRKLNQAQLRLKELEGLGPESGISQADYDRAVAELAQLRRQLADGRLNPRFSEAEARQVSGAVLDPEGGILLGEALLFNEGIAQLKSAQLPTLDQLATMLQTEYPGETFTIEGHTDNQPLAKTKRLFGDNWNLGYQRARSVYEYLYNRGIPKERMVLMTFGYLKPLDPKTQDTEEGRRLNRRVVIRRGGTRI